MKIARALFCRFLESSVGGVALVALVVFGIFASAFLASTAHAQGEGVGTLPVIVHRKSFAVNPGVVWTMRDGPRVMVVTSAADSSDSFTSDPAATTHTFNWTSKHISHTLTVSRGPGETSESFEARCAEELNAALRHFPADAGMVGWIRTGSRSRLLEPWKTPSPVLQAA